MTQRRSNGSPTSNMNIWFVVALTAIPSFLLGTTLSMIVRLDPASSCLCSDAGRRHHPSSISSIADGVDGSLQSFVMESPNMEPTHLTGDNTKKEEMEKQIRILRRRLNICQSNNRQSNNCTNTNSNNKQGQLFPVKRVGRYAIAMARTPKVDFTQYLDLGVPIEPPKPGSEDVIMIYSRVHTFPRKLPLMGANSGHGGPIPNISMPDAIENCNILNVILTDYSGRREQCVAIVPQYESFHIQRWMRMNNERREIDSNTPLQLVSRGQLERGLNEFEPPDWKDTRHFWVMLKNYLDTVDEVKAELRPILKRIAIDNKVVVMVCNFGQSELLMNFVCAARSRELDLSNVIVFATDQDTVDIAQGLGLTAYYDHRNFGYIPSEAAQRYGDKMFTAMMLAKAICVQLVSMLGFDLLFQDVDVIWFRNPLQYFQNTSSPAQSYDIFFQDDGAHSLRFAPYSANTGFYFVRHNTRTRHFLTSLLMAGDLIIKTDSHQAALIALLAEHVSLYGLKAKVLNREMEEFPGGYQFHQKTGKYMRAFFAGKVHPYIFHMSWTTNKDNKIKFFRQVGGWFVYDQCIEKKATEISGADPKNLKEFCCTYEPLISCHYRDKPSKIRCDDSPNIDEHRKPFW